MCTHMHSREPSVVAKDFFTSLPTNHSNGFCWNAGSAFGVQSGHRRRTPRRSRNASWAAFFRLSLFLGFSLHFMSVSPFLGLVDHLRDGPFRLRAAGEKFGLAGTST